MPGLLRTRIADRHALVSALAVLDESECREVLDEARGASLIPLAELVIEGLGPDIDSLSQHFGADVVIDDLGRRCVTRDAARTFIRKG